ncbi:MAG: hypothetical protein ABI651_02805 [Verrucomicrobiota bacterium]
MSRLRVFKIVACFLLTFALGALAGWLLKPSASAVPAGPRSIPSSQRVMENLDARLKLTPEQKAKLQPLLDEWKRQVEQFPRRPRRRRDLFEQYAPRIREALAPAQQVEYDRLVAEIRERFDKRLR